MNRRTYYVLTISAALSSRIAHAEPYVRTWDQHEIQKQTTCTRLLDYIKTPTSDESRCETLRQMNSKGCFGIKGFPDLREEARTCKTQHR